MDQSVPLLDLKAQYATLREEIDRALARVVESQAFILGEAVRRFEEQVAAYTGSAHAIGCASGTDALILSLAALDLGPGDEVLTTPFSFFATASCAYKVGARPAFCDIEPDSFNLDVSQVEERLTDRTRALLPVHLFGQCADMNALLEIGERRGLAVVEDAAQSLSARYTDASGAVRHAGAMGRLGCFSFFPSKNLGGFGDGGMIVTDDDALADRLYQLRVHGGAKMYQHRWVGWNSRLDAIQAAVLAVKLPHLDGWSRRRAENAGRYDRWFAESGLIEKGLVTTPPRAPNGGHIFNQYTLRVARRDALREHLKTSGIGNAVYYPIPLHLQDCFAELGYRKGDFPRAERASEEVLSLPVYPELSEEKQRRVVGVIADFYAGAASRRASG